MPKLRKNWIIKGKLSSTVDTVAAEKLCDDFIDYVEQELDLLPIGGANFGEGAFEFIISREDASPVLIENKINQLKLWLTEQSQITEVEIDVQ